MFQQDYGETSIKLFLMQRNSSTSQVISNSIRNCEYFLSLLSGWSVFTEISLLRGEEDPDGSKTHLGNLLKKKADEEGVKVLVLTWNDQTSGKTYEGYQILPHPT